MANNLINLAQGSEASIKSLKDQESLLVDKDVGNALQGHGRSVNSFLSAYLPHRFHLAVTELYQE